MKWKKSAHLEVAVKSDAGGLQETELNTAKQPLYLDRPAEETPPSWIVLVSSIIPSRRDPPFCLSNSVPVSFSK